MRPNKNLGAVDHQGCRQPRTDLGVWRCSLLGAPTYHARLVVTALTAKAYKLWVPPHTAECVVEQSGQMKTIKATLAPKIEFKNGRVEKIWINLQGIEGTSSITGLLSAGATLVDSTGLFHSQMIKEANKYIYTQCPKNYPEVLAESKPKVNAKKAAKTTLPSDSVAPK